MRNKKDGVVLHCFSPPVMLATFIIEIGLLVYTLWRYKLNAITRLAVALLFFLALFQLAEYYVCGGIGMNAETWSRVGFVAITILPPLGIHLAQVISKRGLPWLKWAAYGTAAFWVYIFTLGQQTFKGHECAGNYVIFQLGDSLGGLFLVYYYFWLIVGIGLCTYFARTATKRIRSALLLQVAGYLVFLVPTTVTNTVKPETIAGLPSIMCGFAILFALVLTFGIMPTIGTKKPMKKK